MADKTIWEYPTLATADPDDLILMASDETTYNMQVATLKAAMGEAASKPPVVRNGNWWVWSAAQNDYVDSGTAATGPQGPTGNTGPAAGFGTVTASVDSNVGTPSVGITTSGPDTAKNIAFEFHNIKGTKGDTGNTGPAAGFGTVTASVDSNVGTPSVGITTSGPDTAKNIAFEFHNIKGDVTPAAQQAVSDAQAAAQAASESAHDAEDAAAEVEQKLDGVSAYGEVGPVAIASIQDALPLNAESLVVGIQPVQDLHGYDNPWPAGGGINQFDLSDATPVSTGRAYNLTVSVDETEETITASGSASWPASGGSFSFAILDVTKNYTGLAGNVFVVSKSSNITSFNSISYSNGAIVINATVAANGATSIVLRISFASTSQTAWTPYSNICPISGWTGAELTVNEDVLDIAFPSEAGTVYGGTLDVANGVLTVNRAMVAFDGTEAWGVAGNYCYIFGYPEALNNGGSTQISSHYKTNLLYNEDMLFAQKNGAICKGARNDLSAWKAYLAEQHSNGTPVQICYELTTPITYQLTPQQVTLLQGVNTVFADCGGTTVGYWRDDSLSINKAITERAYDKKQGEALADNVSALSSAMTYVVSGNKSIESVAIPVGSYVRLIGSTIAGCSDGIYTVATAIPVNTVIDGTYFNESAPIQGGGLNAVSNSIPHIEKGLVLLINMIPFQVGDTYRYYDITFAKQYSSPPNVITAMYNDNIYNYGFVGTEVSNITTTGCRVAMAVNIDTNQLGVEWVAIGN